MNRRTEEITLPYDVFRGILAPEGTRPEGLVPVLVPEGMANVVDESVVSRWRVAQSGEIAARLNGYLPVLSNPRRVSRVSIVMESGGFYSFLAVRGDSDPEKPVLVCYYREMEREVMIARFSTLYHLAGDLAGYITPGPPLSGSNLGLSMQLPPFLILCAMADLIRRRFYASLLDHTTITLPIIREDILNVIGDARKSRDLRWLLPHLFSLLPDDPAEYLKGDLTNEFSWLVGHNYLGAGRNEEEYLCSDSCMDFLKLLNAGTSRLGIMNLHQGDDMGIMMESACFIRVPRAIIAINIGNGKEGITAVLSTLNFEQLLEFTTEFLSGTDIPEGMAPAQPESRGPSSPAEEVQKITCPHCKAPLPLSAKFCRKCGSPVTREAS